MFFFQICRIIQLEILAFDLTQIHTIKGEKESLTLGACTEVIC